MESEDPQKKKAISVNEFYKACVNGNVTELASSDDRPSISF